MHIFYKGVNKIYSSMHNEIRVWQLKVCKEFKHTVL